MNNIVAVALIIVVAISLTTVLFLTTNRYTEAQHVQVFLSKTSSPKCYNGTCYVLLDLKIKNYNQKMYYIRAIYFSILAVNNVTQAYYGYNPENGACNSISEIEILGENCANPATCYLSLCYGNVTLPDLAERTYSIKIMFNQSNFITSVAVVVVMYDALGNEYRVSSNSVSVI